MSKPLGFTVNQNTFVIAEVAQTHDGNLNVAHAFIDAVAKTGADAIKFQTHIAAEESTPQEPWRVRFSKYDETRYDYWRRMEFSREEWAGLKAHAEEKGLYFLSSPFSLAAIHLLENLSVPAWKIGSGEVLSRRMLDAMIQTQKPIIFSSGMSPIDEIDELVAYLRQNEASFALMQCTTSYPSKYQQVGLNIIDEYKKRYNCPVGLSDHSGTIWPALAAVARGAELIEVHVTMSRDMFGPDVSSSVTTLELAQMVEGIRAINCMNANPVDKTSLSDDLKKMRGIFMKSIVAKCEIKEGDILSFENITDKKPGSGISAAYIDLFIGLTLVKKMARDEQITWEHLSPEDRKRLENIVKQS